MPTRLLQWALVSMGSDGGLLEHISQARLQDEIPVPPAAAVGRLIAGLRLDEVVVRETLRLEERADSCLGNTGVAEPVPSGHHCDGLFARAWCAADHHRAVARPLLAQFVHPARLQPKGLGRGIPLSAAVGRLAILGLDDVAIRSELRVVLQKLQNRAVALLHVEGNPVPVLHQRERQFGGQRLSGSAV